MKNIFWWWFRWAIGFNFSVLGASLGLARVLNGTSGPYSLPGTMVGLVCAATAIALAAVAIAKMRSSR